MTVVIWIVEGTWPACIDAAHAHAPASADIVLLHVTSLDVAAAGHGAYAGLLGRGHREHDPGTRIRAAAADTGRELLRTAAEHLGRPCAVRQVTGRVEREVVAAADGAELLIVARDGHRDRLGPKSLGPATRFVVDHAPCPMLLVWPGTAPDITTIPPPPDPAHRK